MSSREGIVFSVSMRIGKLALIMKLFRNLSLDIILHNSEACMECDPSKAKMTEVCPPFGTLILNVDRVARLNQAQLGSVALFKMKKVNCCSLSQNLLE